MKLASERVEQALSQLDAQVVPDNHPLMRQLSDVFGEHTFFLSAGGLTIVEPDEHDEPDGETGRVVQVARWSDETRAALAPHRPEFTGVVIALGKAA